MDTVRKVPLTPRAITQRINRGLPPGTQLRISRGGARETLGEFYLVAGDEVAETHVDIGELARRLGVLKPWEEPS